MTTQTTSYENAINFLCKELPMFSRSGKKAYTGGLAGIKTLCKQYNNPHEKFKSVHIAGTNGKGSVASIIASVLQEAGYKVGLYTSPHLEDFRERIRINGQLISKEFIASWITQFQAEHKDSASYSFFEVTTALAFEYFKAEEVDIAIIECGLGGRLDSTNIISPVLSVITNVSLDHTNILGTSVEKIAQEKAGIIKKQGCVVIGETTKETEPIFLDTASQQKAEIFFADQSFEIGATVKHFYSSTQPIYKKRNLQTSLLALQRLKEKGYHISASDIRNGVEKTTQNSGLLGRWQIVHKKPLTICDVAHNEAGLSLLIDELKQMNYKQLHIIYGCLSDKEPQRMAQILSKLPRVTLHLVPLNTPRAMDTKTLYEIFIKNQTNVTHANSMEQALHKIKKSLQEKDILLVTGSHYTVASFLKYNTLNPKHFT